MRKFFFFILFSIYLATSCHKDPPPEPTALPYKHTPQEMLDYIWFQPGSYWTYQDSATGHTRTVTVTGTDLDTFSVQFDDGRWQKGDHRYVDLYATYDESHWIWFVPMSFDITNTSYNLWGLLVHRSSSGFSSGWSSAMSVPVIFGTTYVHSYDTVTYAPTYVSMTVNNITYDSLVRVYHSRMSARKHPWLAGGPKCFEYYRRGYGLIRFEIPDSNQVWNLIDYEVNL